MKLIPSILLGAIVFVIAVKSLPVLFFNLGTSAYNKENYISAYNYFSKAKNLSPTNVEYKYEYARTLSKLKPTIKVQKEIFELSEEKKYNKAVGHAKQQIINWNKQISTNYGMNYIEQAPYDSSILRWNPKTFPLKVSVDFPVEEQLPEYYRNEITKAFYQWQNSTAFIKFTFSSNINESDIVVKFLPLPKNNCSEAGCKYVVAYTEPTIKGGQLKKMTITLYDRDAYGNYFSDRELYNTILHEIGHALGIMGHSYSTEDLMYMASTQDKTNSIYSRYRSSFQYISSKDINTLRLLYNITPNITNTPLSEVKTEGLIYAPIVLGGLDKMNKRKIEEAQNYIKKAPDLPGGYIDLASAYSESGNLRKAEENLNKALSLSKTGNEKYIIYYNFAAVYLNNNRPKDALSYAQEAQTISHNEEIADMISNIEHALATDKEPFKNSVKR